MEEYGKCPNCGSKLVKKEGKFGSFLSCSNFPKCKFSMDYKPENIGLNFDEIENCPNCGSKLVKKEGKFGSFFSCSNFPKCKFSMNCKENTVEKTNPSNTICPECGSQLIKKSGKYGEFMGCSNFPKCRFTKNITSTHEKSENDILKNKTNGEFFSFQDRKYKSKVKLAKNFVFKTLNKTIEELISDNWDEDVSLCTNIIENNVTYENEKYIEENLGYAHHRRDKRSSLEYACDLMVGWIIEDSVVEMLTKLGFNTSLNSSDKHRKLLLKPTADSDLKISINGKNVLIEQVNDFTGYWKKTMHVPMRDNKYNNLKNENSLLFGIDFVNELFFLLDVSNTDAYYIPYHKPFSKPAYALKINEADFYNIKQVEPVFSKLISNC